MTRRVATKPTDTARENAETIDTRTPPQQALADLLERNTDRHHAREIQGRRDGQPVRQNSKRSKNSLAVPCQAARRRGVILDVQTLAPVPDHTRHRAGPEDHALYVFRAVRMLYRRRLSIRETAPSAGWLSREGEDEDGGYVRALNGAFLDKKPGTSSQPYFWGDTHTRRVLRSRYIRRPRRPCLLRSEECLDARVRFWLLHGSLAAANRARGEFQPPAGCHVKRMKKEGKLSLGTSNRITE